MTMLFTQTYVQGALMFEAERDSLTIDAEGHRLAHLCGLPPHVAAHTAAAFNRAMQAVPDRGGWWTYATKSGVWHISRDLAMGTVYFGQHEDVTGDGDPGYLFAQSGSLIGCMDEIDATEAENACTECFTLVGDDTTEVDGTRHLCKHCLWDAAERAHELREMADDDMAHAAREKAMGL